MTIPLREGVAWDDGEPFSSADVVFTIETLMKYEGFNDSNFFDDNVASVTAPDDNTVVFKLKQAELAFPHHSSSIAGAAPGSCPSISSRT